MEQERDTTIPTVPCSNSFEALNELDDDESSPRHQQDVCPPPEHNLAFKCLECEELLRPINSANLEMPKLHPTCCIRDHSANIELRNFLQCGCPPAGRFVCIDCVQEDSDDDIEHLFGFSKYCRIHA